jgi:hypothetical protein
MTNGQRWLQNQLLTKNLPEKSLINSKIQGKSFRKSLRRCKFVKIRF